MALKQINVSWRDLKIDYEVDMKSVAELAEKYGISWDDMKWCLHQYGFTVRKKEVRPSSPAKEYTIVLTDKDKVVVQPTVAVTAAN